MSIAYLLFFALSIVFVNSEVQPKLVVTLQNAGFHRNLEYNLQLLDIKCEFALVQNLPSAIYVNLDQLNDLKRFQKIKTYVPTNVDVELTTEKAPPITVYMFGRARNSNIVNLPINYRYHTPDDIKFIKVTITPPSILIRCQNEIQSLNETKVNAPCSNSHLILEENVVPYICEWKELEFINNPMILNAAIPVGSRKLWLFVAFGTLTTSWLGCIFIVYSIHQRKNLRKKL